MKIAKNVLAATVAALVLFLGVQLLQGKTAKEVLPKLQNASKTSIAASSNVYIEDGVQIIEIFAKGGYDPYETTAKARLPTILRFVTDDTFDCSSIVMIPDFRIRKRLPLSGKTDIQLPTIMANQTITVYCGMGMYYFNLNFV